MSTLWEKQQRSPPVFITGLLALHSVKWQTGTEAGPSSWDDSGCTQGATAIDKGSIFRRPPWQVTVECSNTHVPHYGVQLLPSRPTSFGCKFYILFKSQHFSWGKCSLPCSLSLKLSPVGAILNQGLVGNGLLHLLTKKFCNSSIISMVRFAYHNSNEMERNQEK